MASSIRIALLANATQANRAFASVGASANGMSARVGRAGKLMGAALVAGAAVAGVAAFRFGKASVQAASAAEQSLGATETVFGKYADTVIKRSNEAATAIGLSANEYRELSNVVGASLTGAGVSIKKAAGLTDQLNRRASDMAATFGGTTREAVESISSLLRGETDPIEKYGVSIKESDVSARLAAKGLDGLTGSALKQAQMQTRLQLVMEKTNKTQGAFKRESNTLAHQQQVLGAQWENLKAKVGTALLPVLTRFLTFLNANLMPAFAAIGDAVRPVIDWFKRLGDGADGGTSKLGALSDFMQNRVAPAVQSVIDAYKNLIGVLLPIITQIATAVTENWSKIQPQVSAIWTSVKNIIIDALSIIASVVKIGTKVIQTVWEKFGGTILRFITTTMTNLATFLKGAFQIIEGLFKVVSSVLRGDWKGAWDGIKKIASGAVNVVKAVVSQAWNMIRTATSVAWTAIKALIGKVWDGILSVVRTQIGVMVDAVRGIQDKVTGVFSGARDWLLQAGKDILAGLGDGIDAARDWIMDKIEAIADAIPDWLAKRLGIASPSKVMRRLAKWIPLGIAKGIEDGRAGIKKVLDAIGTSIEKYFDKKFKNDKVARAHTRAALKDLKDEYRALIKNGKAQDKITKKLNAAREALKALKDARRDYAASVRDNVLSYTNVTGLDTAFNSNAIAAELRKRLEKVRQFTAIIQDLIGRGLNQTMIDQLVQAGVEGGLATALAIQQGGAGAISEFNDLQSQINQAAGSLGNTAAGSMYNAGIQAAEGLIKGLEERAKRLDAWARKFAAQLIKAIKRELGIKSPSRVFAEIGKQSVLGLEVGLRDTSGVKRAVVNLADTMTTSFAARPAIEMQGSSGSSGSSSATQRIEIRLTAEQVNQVQRGRVLMADIDAARQSGNQWRVV